MPTDCPNGGTNYLCDDGECWRTHCVDICNRYDAGNLHPTLGNPHAPWNLTDLYWGEEPLFPLNRRGLGIPAVVYPAEVGGYENNFEKNGDSYAGICTGLSCETTSFSEARRVLPGMVLMQQNPFVSSTSALLIMHEIGHALRLGHSVDANIENRQPNHVSVMNYDYAGIANFLDFGDERPSLSMIGEEIVSAETQAACCCGESPCVAEWATDQKIFCCPTCGVRNDITGMCEKCLAVWVGDEYGCIYDGIPQYGLVAEEDCCCGPACTYSITQTAPDWCPPTTTYDDEGSNGPICRVCNAVWTGDACYYGGLLEAEGIGATPTFETIDHEAVVFAISCLNELQISFEGVTATGTHYLAEYPLETNNVDWNNTGTLSVANPVPGKDLVFRHLGACHTQPTPLGATLDTYSEWEFLFDLLAVPFAGTQGLGLPAFCDGNFGCPEGWECTDCGWCADLPGVTVPEPCVVSAEGPVGCALSSEEEE